MSASGQKAASARIRAISALTPISDIGRHACYRCELGASARHKAADLGVAVTVVIGPHNSRTKAVVRRPDLSRSLRLHGARQGQAARWLRAPWPGTRHCRRVRSAPGAAGGTSANPICPRQCQSSRRRIRHFHRTNCARALSGTQAGRLQLPSRFRSV